MQKLCFPDNFVWGSATASYQVEGAAQEGGRRPSIWDTFSAIEGAVADGDDGSVAADQYHRYAQDIQLMKKIGLHAYRFSISWSRIIPDGDGEVNSLGIDYYQRLIHALKEADIKPVATLYHWDLPQSLEDKGGWRVRETAYAFKRYAQVCFEAFGKDVEQWITINEPWCIAYLGHLYGEHAPGHKSMAETIQVIHTVNLAHGLAVESFRNICPQGEIGIAWNPILYRPATRTPLDMKAAQIASCIGIRVFTDPVLHGTYPDMVNTEFGWKLPIEPGDLDIIRAPLDFIGVNYYNEEAVEYDSAKMFHFAVVPHWQNETVQHWPIVPGGLDRVIRWINKESGGRLPIYITENGCSANDAVDKKGRIHDIERIGFLFEHFKVCSALIEDGIPLRGYFVWSFIDNFEWAWGYTKRFGIVYCDYATQRRILKDSAYFMRDVITGYTEF
ncbi:MAG: GH1 family beta-glucosidase [Sphaerochaetaceae bacterium]